MFTYPGATASAFSINELFASAFESVSAISNGFFFNFFPSSRAIVVERSPRSRSRGMFQKMDVSLIPNSEERTFAATSVIPLYIRERKNEWVNKSTTQEKSQNAAQYSRFCP